MDAFYRRLRLRYHFRENQSDEPDDPDPFVALRQRNSTWTPPIGENRVLDKFISKCRKDIEPKLHAKPIQRQNLSRNERIAIKSLKCNQDIIIKSADKGGAVVVWRKDLYIQEAERQLQDTTTYTKLVEDPTESDQKFISNTIKTHIKRKELPSTAQHMIHPCPRSANFYMLPKIHKVDCPGRPIVSSHSCPTVLIAQYLDSVLAPLVTKLPTYIKDSPDALRLIQDFRYPATGERFLFTMDVCALYTSIPHALSMEALRHFLDSRSIQNPSTDILLRLIDLALTRNTFQFNGSHYRQLKGIAMGSKIGPSVACLTVGYVEHQMLMAYDGPKPVLLKRYIDDIVGAFTGTRQELDSFINHVDTYHQSLKFTHEISTVSVNFLDLNLSIHDDRITTNIFYKPTDSHSYLMYQSSHPPACKKSIPYSQLLRAKRICSTAGDLETAHADMIQFFSDRGYPSDITKAAFERIKTINRHTALQPSPAKTSERVPLVLTYHPLNVPIRNVIFKNFQMLLKDGSTKDTFTALPVTAYRRDKNIGDHIVRASHPHTPQTTAPGTFRCDRKVCNTCTYVTNNTHFSGPQGSFDVTEHFTCTTRGVVYAIRCSNCNIMYIGETQRRLADRVTEHLRSITKNFDGFPVARHFNPPSACQKSDVEVAVLIQARGSNKDRLEAEHRLIYSMGTMQPRGLNNKFCVFNI